MPLSIYFSIGSSCSCFCSYSPPRSDTLFTLTIYDCFRNTLISFWANPRIFSYPQIFSIFRSWLFFTSRPGSRWHAILGYFDIFIIIFSMIYAMIATFYSSSYSLIIIIHFHRACLWLVCLWQMDSIYFSLLPYIDSLIQPAVILLYCWVRSCAAIDILLCSHSHSSLYT